MKGIFIWIGHRYSCHIILCSAYQMEGQGQESWNCLEMVRDMGKSQLKWKITCFYQSVKDFQVFLCMMPHRYCIGKFHALLCARLKTNNFSQK